MDAFGAYYAVPLFFLISGYCIHLSNLKYIKLNECLPLKTYYKSRFIRIYPPYILAVVVSVAVNLLTHYGKIPSGADLFIHLFCLQGFSINYFNTINLVLWTITIEIAFYIIYPLFYYLRLKLSLNWALIATFIVSCLNIFYFSLQKNISLPQYYWVGNIWFAWCCGAYIADKLAFDPVAFKSAFFKIAYCLIALLFISFEYFQISYLSIVGYQLKIIIWTAPLIYVISKEDWLSRQKSIFLKIITGIGLSSYSLYLLHEPLTSLKNYLVHCILPVQLQKTGVVIGVMIIPLITWLSYCYIEKPFLIKRKPVKA